VRVRRREEEGFGGGKKGALERRVHKSRREDLEKEGAQAHGDRVHLLKEKHGVLALRSVDIMVAARGINLHV
jgi:hypothetical protein